MAIRTAGNKVRRLLSATLTLTALIAVGTTSADAAFWSMARHSSPSSTFATSSFKVGKIAATGSWAQSSRGGRRDLATLKRCIGSPESCGTRGMTAWAKAVSRLRTLPAAQRLQAVNREINALGRYRSDRSAFGVSDHWASPAEFFERGGDCEDFAIAKYWTLRALGYSGGSMKVTVVNIKSSNEGHAVLQVGSRSRSQILDNRVSAVKTATATSYYSPLYAVSASGSWLYAAK